MSVRVEAASPPARMLRRAGLLLALATTPASYRGAHGRAVAQQMVDGMFMHLGGYLALAALLSLVLARIVATTAVSYGLTQYAVEMLIRVLVLELIPLAATLYVALRIALPKASQLAALRQAGAFAALRGRNVDPWQRLVLPRALAVLFAVLLLVAASVVVAALLAYLAVHGLTTGGAAGFTRAVGHTIAPATAVVFVAKTLWFGLATAALPAAAAAGAVGPGALARLFAVLLLVEIATLIALYG